MNRIKNFIIVIITIVVSIYFLKSISYFYNLTSLYKKIYPEYTSLIEQKEYIINESKKLQTKVQGIREQSLNKDILSERVKIMLNYKNKQEITLY